MNRFHAPNLQACSIIYSGSVTIAPFVERCETAALPPEAFTQFLLDHVTCVTARAFRRTYPFGVSEEEKIMGFSSQFLAAATVCLLPHAALSASIFTDEVLSYTANGPSISINYSTVATEATALSGTPSLNVPDTKTAQNAAIVLLPKFNPDFGVLDFVEVSFAASATTTATRFAVCETLLGGILCGSRVNSTLKTSLGVSAPGSFGDGSFGPPSVGGVPSAPTSDRSRSTNTSGGQSFAVGGAELFRPLELSTDASITYGRDPAAYIGTGFVEITGEIWSQITDDINCLGALVTCQGGSGVEGTMDWSASVKYFYTKETILPDPPMPSPVPLPASSLLLLAGLGALGLVRRRAS